MSRIKRLSKIARVAMRYRLDTFIEHDNLPGILRWVFAFSPWRVLSAPTQPRGERLRLALEALGPVFIKFGQMLSTRGDLLPGDIILELAKLQDQVPPFPSDEAIALIEKELGQSVDSLFKDFSHQPMASASIAQVHAATLPSGEQVVVKVVRPGIEKIIQQDIRLMFTLARKIERYLADGPRLRPVDVVDEYQHTLLDELDMQREGANTSQLRRNFSGSNLLYVPEVIWDYSGTKILTLERIDGIAVTDVDALEAQGTNMKLLAESGVEIFFTQVFRDSFFHADMHPGNVFVSKEHPDTPQYIAIDCAIIGSLSDSDQYYLARNLLAIFQRDYRLVAQLHVESGWVDEDTKIHEFEAAVRSVCEPIFEKPLGEISFGQLLLNLFQIARRFDMQVQPSLVLLQKTLLHIEGLGRELYPELNLWHTAQPFLERWIRERYSPAGIYNRTSKHIPAILEQLPHLPNILLRTLEQLPDQNDTKNRDNQIELLQKQWLQQRKSHSRSQLGLLLLLIAAGIAHPDLLKSLGQLPPISWGLACLATLLWLKR